MTFVPVNQLASRPSSLAKYGSSDRAGIGASPGYDSWEIKVAMTRFISGTYGPQLTSPGMPSAMDCSMAILNKGRAWWSRPGTGPSLTPRWSGVSLSTCGVSRVTSVARDLSCLLPVPCRPLLLRLPARGTPLRGRLPPALPQLSVGRPTLP